MGNSKLIISPKTKVMQLIEAYPQLEEVLISYVPAFSKLKNPLLRKTVAKIATLQQAAVIGNVKVEDLINHLRKRVNQEPFQEADPLPYNRVQPSWFDTSLIKTELDIAKMLNEGEHPVNLVITYLNQISPDEIYKITAPFLPAPLIDKSLSLNIDHWIDQVSDELFVIYFKRRYD